MCYLMGWKIHGLEKSYWQLAEDIFIKGMWTSDVKYTFQEGTSVVQLGVLAFAIQNIILSPQSHKCK